MRCVAAPVVESAQGGSERKPGWRDLPACTRYRSLSQGKPLESAAAAEPLEICMCRIQELQQAVTEAQLETAQAQEGRQDALAEADARLRDAEDAGSLAVSAQEAAEAACAHERAARQAASEADACIQAAKA